jgi:hypothetical protein
MVDLYNEVIISISREIYKINTKAIQILRGHFLLLPSPPKRVNLLLCWWKKIKAPIEETRSNRELFTHQFAISIQLHEILTFLFDSTLLFLHWTNPLKFLLSELSLRRR